MSADDGGVGTRNGGTHLYPVRVKALPESYLRATGRRLGLGSGLVRPGDVLYERRRWFSVRWVSCQRKESVYPTSATRSPMYPSACRIFSGKLAILPSWTLTAL